MGSVLIVYGRRGPAVRVIYLLIALVWWVASAFGRFGRGNVVVLCYHAVTATQRERFRRQMTCIARRTVASHEVPAIRGRRIGRLPRVCVTFDDAFACLRETAIPIMEQLDVPAVVFAVPGNLGVTPRWPMPPGHSEAGLRVMTGEELKSTAASPICRIGSHTMTHPDLSTLAASHVRRELAESKTAIENLLGTVVEDLALPFGAYNEDTLAAARDAGYTRIFTLDTHLNPPSADPGVIGRFIMTPDVWSIEFVLTCAGAYAWLGPWRRFVRRLRAVSAPRTASPALS